MNSSPKKSRWGIAVFALPTIFLIFILSLVGYVVFQDNQLVDENYYQGGLAYQDRIDQLQRTALINSLIVVKQMVTDQMISVTFGRVDSSVSVDGEIRMIRPSNADQDRTIAIVVDDFGRQLLSTKEMTSGLWRLEIDWTQNDISYYQQQRIVIP